MKQWNVLVTLEPVRLDGLQEVAFLSPALKAIHDPDTKIERLVGSFPIEAGNFVPTFDCVNELFPGLERLTEENDMDYPG